MFGRLAIDEPGQRGGWIAGPAGAVDRQDGARPVPAFANALEHKNVQVMMVGVYCGSFSISWRLDAIYWYPPLWAPPKTKTFSDVAPY